MNTNIIKREARPFIDEFERQKKNSTSNRDAYEKVESQFEKLTGFRRYSDYDSFRCVRKRIKNR